MYIPEEFLILEKQFSFRTVGILSPVCHRNSVRSDAAVVILHFINALPLSTGTIIR